MKPALAKHKECYERLGRDVEMCNIEDFKKMCIANRKFADIISDIIDVAQNGILPDGDHVNVPTKLWLEDVAKKYKLIPENREDESE